MLNPVWTSLWRFWGNLVLTLVSPVDGPKLGKVYYYPGLLRL